MKNILILIFLYLSHCCYSQDPLITTWKTDNPGVSCNSCITIPVFTFSGSVNYDVDWENDGIYDAFNITGNATHNYGSPGTYEVAIRGSLSHLFFANSTDKEKILSVEQWGDVTYNDMTRTFEGCSNLQINASDAPDLSNVTDLDRMFISCTSLNGDLSNWDVSSVIDMKEMFSGAVNFNSDIGNWDVSSVTTMQEMFQGGAIYPSYTPHSFNQDIGDWDVSSVLNMREMFSNSSFNQNIGDWDVSNVASMVLMFQDTPFNQDIGSWDMSSVIYPSGMFSGASEFNQDIGSWDMSSAIISTTMFYGASAFNQDLSNWNVSSITSMRDMFNGASAFNQPLNSWDVSSVNSMEEMFSNAVVFDQTLDSWDVSSVTNMLKMFENAESFNQPLNSWDVSSVTNMERMFSNAVVFDQTLDSWNTSNVTNMKRMFYYARLFNQDIGNWNVSNVIDMSSMFSVAQDFNQDIGNWNVSSVIDMSSMFRSAQDFNQDIGTWDVSNVTNMSSMFYFSQNFNQSLSSWDISAVTAMINMLNYSGLDIPNYDNTLINWAIQNVQSNVTLGSINLDYCTGASARADLINNQNWTITGDEENCPCTPPSVTFTAPSNICIDAGIQANLGNGTPTGGVYSGPGVTDDANGITYTLNLAAAGVGVHTLTYDYTDENGCMNSASDNVEIFVLPTVTYTAPADLCVDENVQTGLGGATPVGGVYSGSGVTDDGNGMTYSFDPAEAGVGVHILTYDYTDGNGCMNDESDDVEVFDLPTVSFTAPADLCIDAGVQTGLGGATPTGGVYTGSGVTDDANGVTYSFDPAAAGVGIHTLTYYYGDGNGCLNSASDDVEVFDVPSLTASNGSTTCGLDNGQVILELDVFQPITLHDANGPITYAWGADNVNGFDFYAALFIPAGTYNWHAINESGCAYYFSFTISDSSPLDVSTSTTTTTCGESTGTVSFTLNSGTSPVSIEGSTPVPFPTTALNLSAGNYSWDLVDANGCMFTTSFTINAVDGLDITSNPTPTTCDLDNGAVELTINQGTEPVTYTDNGVAITSFTDLAAGNYTWDAEDANGCTFQVSFFIGLSKKLDIDVTGTIGTTCGLDNGSFTYAVIDGLEPITFTEDGSPVDINQLPEGLHTYVATDANGCTQTLSTLGIGSSDPLVSVAQSHGTTCGVADNGWVEIFTVTGTDPVTYTENGVVMSLTDLTPGDYVWDTEDATGCTGQVSFTIEDSEVFEVTAGHPSGSITTKCNEDNGVVYLYHNGGPTQSLNIADANGPIPNQSFCIFLTPSGQACIVSELPAGMYNWTCTDGNGCVDQVSFTVEESDPLDITANPTATSCDLVNGEISFAVNTGTEPITYSENGTPITVFTGLAAGDYSWDAEDALGCMLTGNFTIEESIALTINTTPVHTFCDGNNGSVTGTMITGNVGATFTLNDQVNTTGVYTNLAQGTYTMTAVDQNFCPASSTFTINGSDPLEITTVVTPTFCNEDNGSITATLDSGTAPVEYTIAGQGTNTTGAFTDLPPGTYTMNAEDAVGCEATETFTIAPSEPLDINTVIVHTTCELDNGSVTATLMSGTTPVTFTIAGEGSNTTGAFSDLASGNYTMNAEDAEGCEATVSFVIDDSTLPLFTMETIRTSCGDINGSILLTPDPNTGRAPYEFNIGDGWTSNFTFVNLAPGNYTVDIRDSDGCQTSQETNILDSEQLLFTNHIDHADCGNLSGIITLVTLQGTEPFIYSISTDFLFRQNSSGVFGFLEAGKYIATITGSDGCIVTEELTVENDHGVRLDVEVTHPECGETNGSILFRVGETGTMPYQLYINGNLLDDNLYNEYLISNLENGDYKVEIHDYYGCSDSAEIVIDDGNSIIEAFEIDPIACDGTLGKVSAILGEGEYTFILNGLTQSSGNFEELNIGEYTMYATDSMGCDIEKDFTIGSIEFTKMGVEIFPNRCGDLADIGISVNGGLAPYNYYLNDQFQGSRYISNLEIGEYEVKVIDSNGCELIEIVTITGETELSYELVRCQEIGPKGFGYIVVEASGGTAPYRYQLGQYYNNHGRFSRLEESEWLLTITDVYGCELQEVITICETNTQSQKADSRNSFAVSPEMSIYPNPTRNLLNIKYRTTLDQILYIYNINGNKIHSQSIYKDTLIHSISIQSWPSGVYYIKITNSPTSYRFVKID